MRKIVTAVAAALGMALVYRSVIAIGRRHDGTAGITAAAKRVITRHVQPVTTHPQRARIGHNP